jgi:hypothetical protein
MEKTMPLSIWKQHTFSLATDPISDLTNKRTATLMGGIAVDLISAPIEPGTYDIHFAAVMGGITMFLPACATLQPEGRSFWGGTRLHGTEQFWPEMRRVFAPTAIQVPSTPPPWAIEPHQQRDVTLRISVSSLMGGMEIHQLEVEPDNRMDKLPQ